MTTPRDLLLARATELHESLAINRGRDHDEDPIAVVDLLDYMLIAEVTLASDTYYDQKAAAALYGAVIEDRPDEFDLDKFHQIVEDGECSVIFAEPVAYEVMRALYVELAAQL